jgi:hypothetical protein
MIATAPGRNVASFTLYAVGSPTLPELGHTPRFGPCSTSDGRCLKLIEPPEKGPPAEGNRNAKTDTNRICGAGCRMRSAP